MSALASGTIIAEKFRLDKPIGSGGMGSVWQGVHLSLDAPVAVKFMSGDLVDDAMARTRFEREAKAAARIRSAHIVHIYDHGVHEGMPYIVLEYLEGEDLRKKLRRDGPLALESSARLCVEIAKGLERAHREGVIHRDLKPSNIFLSAPDDGMAKIIDFGIAKRVAPVSSRTPALQTESDTLLGSPLYMSPEQVRSMPLDGRSDNWNLAMLLYEVLTGRLPFAGREVGSVHVAICMDPIPPPSTHRPDLGEKIDAFFVKGFQREKEQRHADGRAVAHAFCKAIHETEPMPIRDSWFEDAIDIPTNNSEATTLEASVGTASTQLDMINLVARTTQRRRWASMGIVGLGCATALIAFLVSSRNVTPGNATTDAASNRTAIETTRGNATGTNATEQTAPSAERRPIASADTNRDSSAPPAASSTATAHNAKEGRPRPAQPPSAATATPAIKPSAPPAKRPSAPSAPPPSDGPGLGYQ